MYSNFIVDFIKKYPFYAMLSPLVPFKGPKNSRAPQKVSILCRDHLESLNWPHLVIWQGRIHKNTPHLQHRCINSYFTFLLSNVIWENFPDENIKFLRNKEEFNKKLKTYLLKQLSSVINCTRLYCPSCSG